jgi:predicted transcriptional regulator
MEREVVMTINRVAEILDADIVCGEEKASTEVFSACGADLMSDVMAFVKEQVLLLTGLINVQVIRTANLMDIDAICFVRGKKPSEEMVEMAREMGIILLKTKLPLFLSCGRLYEAGLTGGGVRVID